MSVVVLCVGCCNEIPNATDKRNICNKPAKAVASLWQEAGKALAAYVALGSEEASNYRSVKAAILHQYDVNDEVRQQRFCSDKKNPV